MDEEREGCFVEFDFRDLEREVYLLEVYRFGVRKKENRFLGKVKCMWFLKMYYIFY